MNPGSILFVLAILVLVGAYLARPLSKQVAGGLASAHPKRSRLQAQRERLLDTIQELDADHAMGKVLPEEYRQQRRRLARQGAEVLRQLDELGGAAPAAELETELEARVAELKHNLSSHGSEAVSGGQTADAADRADPQRAPAEAADRDPNPVAAYCPTCGIAAVAGDRFCAQCGTVLSEQGA